MHRIKLIPDEPFETNVEVDVYDVTDDVEGKRRCRIKVEFSRGDIEELLKEGLDFDGIIQYYREWIYEIVRYHILDEWEDEEGLEKVIYIVKEKVRKRLEDLWN